LNFSLGFLALILLGITHESQSYFTPQKQNLQLVIISGCTGTGKSTFGMEVAISRGILKCISTDTIRQIKRGFDDCPTVHRASHSGEGDAVVQWSETCAAIQDGIENILDDCIQRGTSLVLEGVNTIPSRTLIDKWRAHGGVAAGVVLTIPDPEIHAKVIRKRGDPEEIKNFHRIRAIQDEMVELGRQNRWLIIEQKPSLEPRPIELLTDEIQMDLSRSREWEEGQSKKLLKNAKFSEASQKVWVYLKTK